MLRDRFSSVGKETTAAPQPSEAQFSAAINNALFDFK